MNTVCSFAIIIEGGMLTIHNEMRRLQLFKENVIFFFSTIETAWDSNNHNV